MPSCGAPPAWLARPRKRICLTSAPFDESAMIGALRHLIVRADMDHHRHVDVVEMALGDELGLAEQELDLALSLAAQRAPRHR